MPFCTKCGLFINSDDKYCTECGEANEKYCSLEGERIVIEPKNNEYQNNNQPNNQVNCQQGYQTNNDYQNQVIYCYQPQQNDLNLQKKKRRALIFSILCFSFGILAFLVETTISVLGLTFFVPAMINWAQYVSKRKINDAKLALIFNIIGGVLSTICFIASF